MNAPQTWRVSLATRIALVFLASCLFFFAGLLLCLPALLNGADAVSNAVVIATALFIFGFGLFASFALYAAVRTRIAIDGGVLEATVVSGCNALLIPSLREIRLPRSQIRAVECRRELFRRCGFTTSRDALSVVTLSGERIGLCSNTYGTLETLPIDDVATAVAAAAGVSVRDDGTVWAKGSGLYGAASSSWVEPPIGAVAAAKAQRTAVMAAQICTALLLLTFVLRACL